MSKVAMNASEGFEYELRRSARRRTLAIEVHADLRVTVRAPAHADARFIADRVAERGPWIQRTLERFQRAGHVPAPSLQYREGETHCYLGTLYRLRVMSGRKAGVLIDGEALRVTVPGEPIPDRVQRVLATWYRECGLEQAGEVVNRHFGWFEGCGYTRPTLRFRAMRTRWGSLSGGRRMTLNLELMKAPAECLEYVVVHELCHLEHRGHGRAFYELMDHLMPDWRERKRRLARAAQLR
jgi:predicted metal-dependent hydrolase